MSKDTRIPRRKSDHLRISLERDVSSGISTGLEEWAFIHDAVPELDLRNIDIRQQFLGHELKAPILISSMTGGTEEAALINRILAEVAQAKGLAMAIGSQRAAIEDRKLQYTYDIARKAAPDIALFANLGAVQLNYGYGPQQCLRAIEMIDADALILHFNCLQEALNPEGDVDFHNLLPKIEEICHRIQVPVIAKEVGWGISSNAAQRLFNAGVAAIDVAGAGGTSWSQVEMHRCSNKHQARLAASFIDWGIPTSKAILEVRNALPDIPLIASGGLRSGIEIAKCIALGADLGGIAGPLLKAAVESPQRVADEIDLIIAQIRICLFATGSNDIKALQASKVQKI